MFNKQTVFGKQTVSDAKVKAERNPNGWQPGSYNFFAPICEVYAANKALTMAHAVKGGLALGAAVGGIVLAVGGITKLIDNAAS